MLTKMPKVGDVLIAKEDAVNRYDVTHGNEYVITRIGTDGRAWFNDDDEYGNYVTEEFFDYFTLKTAEPFGILGFIGMDPDNTTRESYVVEVFVDDDGYKAIEALARQSYKQRKRSEIQLQINALQAELNAL